jgi:DNA-binding transcriptional MerR regulator
MGDSNLAHLPKIGIGEATRLYGMTLRAIRLYEEMGLVSARRDRFNNRYYDAAARRQLGWISLLRNAGLGLDDIREVLRAEDRDGSGRECALLKLSVRQRATEIELTLIQLATLKLRNRTSVASPARPHGRTAAAAN